MEDRSSGMVDCTQLCKSTEYRMEYRVHTMHSIQAPICKCSPSANSFVGFARSSLSPNSCTECAVRWTKSTQCTVHGEALILHRRLCLPRRRESRPEWVFPANHRPICALMCSSITVYFSLFHYHSVLYQAEFSTLYTCILALSTA